jgi:hypothetical protein
MKSGGYFQDMADGAPLPSASTQNFYPAAFSTKNRTAATCRLRLQRCEVLLG